MHNNLSCNILLYEIVNTYSEIEKFSLTKIDLRRAYSKEVFQYSFSLLSPRERD